MSTLEHLFIIKYMYLHTRITILLWWTMLNCNTTVDCWKCVNSNTGQYRTRFGQNQMVNFRLLIFNNEKKLIFSLSLWCWSIIWINNEIQNLRVSVDFPFAISFLSRCERENEAWKYCWGQWHTESDLVSHFFYLSAEILNSIRIFFTVEILPRRKSHANLWIFGNSIRWNYGRS